MSDHQYALGIEISNPGAGSRLAAGHQISGPGVAIGRLGDDGRAHDLEVEWLQAPVAGRFGGHDDDLMPAIARLLGRRGLLARRDIGLVCVSVGPGGYTSVRIACATAKMIAFAAGAACVAVGTEEVVLAGVEPERRAGRVTIALASKGTSAWMRTFVAGVPTGPGGIVDAGGEDAALAGVEVLVGDAHLPESLRSAARRAAVQIVEPVYDPVSVVRLGAVKQRIDPDVLNPVYPREPDAVTLWRARHGRG